MSQPTHSGIHYLPPLIFVWNDRFAEVDCQANHGTPFGDQRLLLKKM
jgi:hypothetical protein